MTFIKPLKIGTLKLPNNILYAPLSGCSDFPFRLMASRFKPGLMYCEMVKMEALLRADPSSFRLLAYTAAMRPIGAQLYGSNPAYAAKAARMVEELGFDTIDLNCGCPVDKVTKDGSGSGLLKTPLLIGDILATMVTSVSIPVTVKIRLGWDEQSMVHTDLVRIAELAGAKAITIHGRTRRQGYSGKVNLDRIKEAKAAATSICVIGNGDIFTPEAALHMLSYTGCDGVLVARGTFGQPWIAEDIRQLAQEGFVRERTARERHSILLDHFHETLRVENERKALIDMRRVSCWYVGRAPGAKHFRDALSHASSLEAMTALLEEAPIASSSMPCYPNSSGATFGHD